MASCRAPSPAADDTVVLLDVAGGTGDIAFRLRDAMDRSLHMPSVPPKIIVCDINPNMLRVGRQRAVEKGYVYGRMLLQFN